MPWWGWLAAGVGIGVVGCGIAFARFLYRMDPFGK